MVIRRWKSGTVRPRRGGDVDDEETDADDVRGEQVVTERDVALAKPRPLGGTIPHQRQQTPDALVGLLYIGLAARPITAHRR